MRRWITKHRATLTTLLTTAVIALLLGNVVRRQWITVAWLEGHKDAIAAVQSLAAISAIIVAGLLSYYRFFRGRTFVTRAEIAIDVTIVPRPDGRLCHFVNIAMKNIGTLSIWEPTPELHVHRFGSSDQETEVLTNWREAIGEKEDQKIAVVDSDETALFVTQVAVDPAVYAVAYDVFVTADRGQVWKASRTVRNSVAPLASHPEG